jgi:RNA polymerase sigma factor (sigma-70 family)
VTSGGSDRTEIRSAIERQVRRRFAIPLDAFADVVLERATVHQADRNPLEYISRLCLDDLYLAAACCQGDGDAWQECRERYFSYIRDFARRFVHEGAAADVADQVIADLWQRQRLAQYDGRSTLRTWLGAVVAHAAINAGKRERRMTTLDAGTMEARSQAIGGAEDEHTQRLFATLVTRAVEELEPEAKVLLLLYYEQGLTLDEMVSVLGTSKATLSRRLDRLRQGLRAAIEASALHELRVDAATLREQFDFARLAFDLEAALGGSAMEGKRDGVV